MAWAAAARPVRGVQGCPGQGRVEQEAGERWQMCLRGAGGCVWLSHCPSFSRLPDTSALGQIQGVPHWLAGLPLSHGARAAKQAGSSHWFLDHGWSRTKKEHLLILPYYQIILLLLLSQPFSYPPNSLKNLQLAFFHIIYLRVLCSSVRYISFLKLPYPII